MPNNPTFPTSAPVFVHQPKAQSGVVLIMTLVILLIVTLLGVSSVQTTGFIERMARNATDTKAALTAAEAALTAAEAVLGGETSLDPYLLTVPSGGKYQIEASGSPLRWQTAATWGGTNSVEVASFGDTPTPPRYIIEYIQEVVNGGDLTNLGNVGGDAGASRTQIFRITALGTGKSTAAKVYLQTTFGKNF